MAAPAEDTVHAAAPLEPAPVAEALEIIPAEAAPAPLFSELGLSDELMRAVDEMGYRTPTPIQAQAIPVVLMGRDVLGCAQTGTGKTASFTLPMIDILSGARARARMPRSLILEPTRELALQVSENFVQYGKYLKLNHALLIGGESMTDQKDALMRGVDVLIATPGRLIDLFERGGLLLSDVKMLVIDEADRMLDMGFIPDVERIVGLLPHNRQTLFFSATMAPEIRRLADAFLQNPKTITVAPPASVATTITQAITLVAEHDKREALRRLVRSEEVQNALVFCNRKRDVDILYKSLTRHHFSAGALHGDMTQPQRFATLEKFKAGDLQLLVCSDVAARGLDIGGLSHVFNFDVPHHAEDYVHRIGRTGRAGREGRSFTLATPEDRLAVEAIEKLIGRPIPRMQVEGLDPVEWAEGDGRARRGRGRTAARPAPKRDAPKRDAEPRREPKDETRPDTEAKPAKTRVRAERKRPERAAKQPAAPLAEAATLPEIAGEPRRPETQRAEPQRAESHRAEPHRAEPRHSEPSRDRGPRRDRDRDRRRDDDLGPAVRGFGDDVPAFMLIRPLRREAA
jgi:superfamily II DNA/RNA helicase